MTLASSFRHIMSTRHEDRLPSVSAAIIIPSLYFNARTLVPVTIGCLESVHRRVFHHKYIYLLTECAEQQIQRHLSYYCSVCGVGEMCHRHRKRRCAVAVVNNQHKNREEYILVGPNLSESGPWLRVFFKSGRASSTLILAD